MAACIFTYWRLDIKIAMAEWGNMRPQITEIADIKDIMELRFKPSDRAGSAHLMTPSELRAAIHRARRLFYESPTKPNREESLKRILAEATKRETETSYDRAQRLRQRIAWEVAQEKKEESTVRRYRRVIRY
ncbi:hypothetical protein [Roseovarius sp. ZX-A-9]|uniref:hypothetical protein n=1 Tax=Roseovarius sp. ZX-A-9 TaxID=3014783 RepID=UPI0023306D62|nr:hypothetical protein [Roseovarius sp. ZX-A-9]